MRRKKVSLKVVAIFLSICLTFCESLSYASVPRHPERSEGSQGQSPVIASPAERGEAISIPEEFGKIEESYTSPSPESKTIFYIQDAHDSLEAQENIAKVIDYLVEHRGATTVFEEGYEGPVPTDKFFDFIRDPAVKEKVSYFFLDKLRLGGAEYAHVNRTKDFQLMGADSIKLHLESIEWYRKNSLVQEETANDFEAIHKEIQNLANTHFPKEFKEWMKLKKSFDRKQISLVKYLKRTLTLGQSLRGSVPSEAEAISEYPNLRLLLTDEQSQDKALLETIKSINPRTLFEEIDRLEDHIAQAFLTNERDRQIFRYHETLELLKRLNQIQLTQTEYELVQTTLIDLTTEELAKFIAENADRPVFLSKRWTGNIQNAIQFYETALARDRAIENALTRHSSSSPAILVFGGFHKERITEILRRNGFSYLTISPKIIEIDIKHQVYYREQMSLGSHSLEPPFILNKASRMASVVETGSRAEVRRVYREILLRNATNKLIHAEVGSLEAALTKASVPYSRRSEVRNGESESREAGNLTDKILEWRMKDIIILAQKSRRFLTPDREASIIYDKNGNVLGEGVNLIGAHSAEETAILDALERSFYEKKDEMSPKEKILIESAIEYLRITSFDEAYFPFMRRRYFDWLHNKLGRPLVGAMIVTNSEPSLASASLIADLGIACVAYNIDSYAERAEKGLEILRNYDVQIIGINFVKEIYQFDRWLLFYIRVRRALRNFLRFLIRAAYAIVKEIVYKRKLIKLKSLLMTVEKSKEFFEIDIGQNHPMLSGKGFVMSASPRTLSDVERNSPIYEHMQLPWDPQHFLIPRAPLYVGDVADKESFSQPVPVKLKNIPIKFAGSDEFRIPVELEPYRAVIQQILDYEASINPNMQDYYAYLTIDQSPVQAGNSQRGGGVIHSDGVQGERYPTKLPAGQFYVVSDVLPTTIFEQPFDLTHLDVNQDDLRRGMAEQADVSRSYQLTPYGIFLWDAYVVHQATRAEEDVPRRTFLRVIFTMKKFDSTDDAQTPLFHYHWTLVPRPIPSSLGGFMGYVTNAPDVGKTHDGAQDEEKDNTKPEGNSPDNRSEARRKSREAFANKHLIVDFPDMARNFSDEQISEILFFIEKGGTVYFSRFDPVDSKGLGRFFLDLKSKEEFRDRIVMHRLNLEQLAADHLQGFEGEIFYLASKVSPLNREALKSKLNRVGIRENRIIPLAYRDQTGGTLGVGIKNKAGLLKNQLPDYVQVDSKGRFTIDPSETLFWQGLYHEAFAFAQSA